LRLARERGLMTEIWTYVSRSNPDELGPISALGERLGVDSVFVYFPLLSGHLFDRPEENLTTEERERYRAEFNESVNVFLEFPTEGEMCRGGGASHLAVMPSGDVTFCPPVPYSYGNIAERSLEDCLVDMRADYERLGHCCAGQCPVNSPEYRARSAGRFMY
jgi:MoaA/NifB/PqqE/SkfB family radical SAM enzyme